MNSFVQRATSPEVPAQNATGNSLGRSIFTGKTIAAALLIAVFCVVMLTAHQIKDSWTDEHLMVAWIAFWALVFAVLGLLASPISVGLQSLRVAMQARAEKRAQALADERYWELAQRDSRIMAEISRAMGRDASLDVRSFR